MTALSGKVGARRLGLNRSAWAPSLKREIARSALSADTPSTTSQPARNATAPRLAPPRKNARRAGLGRSCTASFTRSFGSTPGAPLRLRIVPLLPSNNHRAQAFRHEHGKQHVDHEKGDDRAHGEEVHDARIVITTEDEGQFLELHRLPDRKPGQHDDYGREDHAEIKKPLYGVVDGQILVREAEAERREHVGDHLARPDRQELPAEAAGG